jgi:formylglycine-generating enzyme required for sulfatase activity
VKIMIKNFWAVFAFASLLAMTCFSSIVALSPEQAASKAQVNKLDGYVTADGAATHPATGLPTRIRHEATGIVLVLIPAGEFLMGSPESEKDRSAHERQHRRVIRKPFYLGETEVTVGQFRKFVHATAYKTDAERGTLEDGHAKGAFATVAAGDRDWSEAANWQNPFPNFRDYCLREDHPVVQVSWNDARRFCEHFRLQLPTEAQWEYACRAGSRTRFFWGDYEDGAKGYGNFKDTAYIKRFPAMGSGLSFDDGVELLAAVGSYKPNAWKLFDMIGNVEEWCQDAYGKYPADGADESATPGNGNIIRGSSWLDNVFRYRSATRGGMRTESRRDFIGFRAAMVPTL